MFYRFAFVNNTLSAKPTNIMKKLFIATLTVVAFASCKKDSDTPATTTEVTLTASDISKDYAAGKTVNYFSVNTSSSAALTAPVAGEKQTWNYSNLVEAGAFADAPTAATGSFPSNGYFLPVQLGFANGDVQTVHSEYEVGDSGWVRRGVSLPAFTLNFPDYGATIEYKAQDSKYNKLLPLTPVFPMKYNSSAEVTDVVRTENFTVNAAAFGLSNTPGAQTYTNSEELQCMASGKLTLKGYDKAMDVLIVKVHRKLVYNYFLGGAPAPKALLDVLGLTDNTTIDYYWYDYYNPGGEGYLGTVIVDESNHIQGAYFKKK